MSVIATYYRGPNDESGGGTALAKRHIKRL